MRFYFTCIFSILAHFFTPDVQTHSGKVIYEVTFRNQATPNLSDPEIAKLPPEVRLQLFAQLAAATQATELLFTPGESLYRAIDQSEKQIATGTVSTQIKVQGNEGAVYTNLDKATVLRQQDISGTQYLISAALEPQPWVLSDKTKTIHGHVCYKATLPAAERKIIENGKEAAAPSPEIVAWYTKEIPVKAGPSHYHGLPGLILMVDDGFRTIMCKELSTSADLSLLVPPVKGKTVSEAEFKEVQEEFVRSLKNGAGAQMKIDRVKAGEK